MNKDEFQEMLKKAINGDEKSFEGILQLYKPLINSNSYIRGKLDEDLRQHILLQIFKNLSKFKI